MKMGTCQSKLFFQLFFLTWSFHPLLVASFQDFQKNDSFLKSVLNVLEAKKVDYIFEEPPNLYLVVFLVSFFSLLLWIPAENTRNLKKIQHCNYTGCTWFSSVMWVKFWNEDDICIIISDCRNCFKEKTQKAYKQANNFL